MRISSTTNSVVFVSKARLCVQIDIMLTPKRILIVKDEVDHEALLRRELKKAGLEKHVVTDSSEDNSNFPYGIFQ